MRDTSSTSSTGTFSLTIDGMHCGGCVRRVTAALNDLGDDVNVEVGKATITLDPGTSVDDAKASLSGPIADLGFTLTGVTAEG